jgi:hypothetical protein
MSKSLSLAKPNIEQIRQDASALLRAHLQGDMSVCARIRQFSPRFAQASDAAILAAGRSIDTLEVAARERGFQSWRAVQEAECGHKILPGDANLEHLKKQAKKLLKAYRKGDAAALARAQAHCDGGEFTLNDAQFVVAREYGFGSWPRLMEIFETAEGRTTMNRAQLFAIERLHEECARLLGDIFTRHLGQKAVCDTAFVDQTTYVEFVHSLSRPSATCSFSVDAMQSRAVLDIAMPLISLMLGKDSAEAWWLSEEEQRRVEPLFGDVLAELERVWAAVLPTVIGDMAFATDPELIKEAEEKAVVILIAFEINTLERSGLVSLIYPLANGIYELRQHLS